jgi:hypothetical protein
MKIPCLTDQQHIKLDVESLIPHLKICQNNNKFKENGFSCLCFFKNNFIRKPFTMAIITACLLKAISILFSN